MAAEEGEVVLVGVVVGVVLEGVVLAGVDDEAAILLHKSSLDGSGD